MDTKTSLPNGRIKELADRLRGDMSYSQHYAYLLDWYMNDKNGWRINAPKLPEQRQDAKVKAKRRGNIFTRLVGNRRFKEIGR